MSSSCSAPGWSTSPRRRRPRARGPVRGGVRVDVRDRRSTRGARSSWSTRRDRRPRGIPPPRGDRSCGPFPRIAARPRGSARRRRRRRLPRAPAVAVRVRQLQHARPALRRDAVRRAGRGRARPLHDAVDRVAAQQRRRDVRRSARRSRARRTGSPSSLVDRSPSPRTSRRPQGRHPGRRLRRRLGRRHGRVAYVGEDPIRRGCAPGPSSRASCPAEKRPRVRAREPQPWMDAA